MHQEWHFVKEQYENSDRFKAIFEYCCLIFA